MTMHPSRSSDDPALDPRVRTLLAAAAASVETTEPLPGEDEALAAFRTSRQSTGRRTLVSPFVSARAAAAAAIGTGVLLSGGLGAAAAGILPGAAQGTVSTWLGTVGISVPTGEGADENSDRDGHTEETGDNADRRGHAEKTPVEEAEPPSAADHGKKVSDTAKNTTAEGADKGKEIAGVASDGRVDNGDEAGRPPQASAHTPGGSDATDGQEQSAGAADDGKATAEESSDGASSGGSDNRPAGD
jgi:hypothetical protein